MNPLLRILWKVFVGLLVLLVAIGVLMGLTLVSAMREQTQASSTEQIEREKGVAVRLDKPLRRDFVEYLYCDGDVHTPVRSVLRAQIKETVETVNVDIGDAVEKDQLLVKFRTADLNAEISARKAAYEEAKNNYDRYFALLDKGVVSKDVVEARRTLMETAAAALSLKQSELKFTEVRAPMGSPAGQRNGNVRVETRMVQPGEYKREGDELLTLVDLSQVEVGVRVPETGVRYCSQGAKLDFRLEGEEKWRTGTIARISPASGDPNRFFDVLVQVANERVGDQWLLRGGMYAEVRIPLRTAKDALAVPAGALKRSGETEYLFTVVTAVEKVEVAVESPDAKKESGLSRALKRGLVRMGLKKAERAQTTTKEMEISRAHRLSVQTGLRAEGCVQITGGELKDADLIVASPRDDLGDGAKVRVIADKP